MDKMKDKVHLRCICYHYIIHHIPLEKARVVLVCNKYNNYYFNPKQKQ